MSYQKHVEYYDLIYAAKPYITEAEQVRQLLHQHNVMDGSRVLEAACGTGLYLTHLKQWFDVSGFDLSEGMVAVTKRKLPDVTVFSADMRTFTVEQPVDALLCLFSSIGFLETDADLDLTLQAFRQAIKPNGVLLIEPWLTPEQWQVGLPSMDTYSSNDLHVCRQCVSEREGDISVLDMHYLIAERDQPVRYSAETLRLRMIEPEKLRHHVAKAGFATHYDNKGISGRGLITAIKQ